MNEIRRIAVLSACLAAVMLPSVAADEPSQPLKDAFQGSFRVGAAVGTGQIMGLEPAALELVAREFNTVTNENALKWVEVHPASDRYNFEPADRYVDWAEKHGMFIVGHTLVWHNQTPPWAFAGVDGKPLDRATALARLKDHITTVVGRYRGRIDAWDVVNEAIADSGQLRTGPVGEWPNRGEPWHAAIGDDYIEQAFQFAHAADPDAELYYNDFNEWKPVKIAAVAKLVRDLQAKGVRIDGVGLQGHWGLDYPTVDELDRMFVEYGKLGVKLMITELDVSVLPNPLAETTAETTERAAEGRNPFPKGLTEAEQQKLAARYAEIFRVFMKHSDVIDRVTFWGVHDGQSWRNNWPVPGRTDYPLLFDRQLHAKPACAAVLETAQLETR
jgi:endo-1,4-beta-xylanase